MEKRESYKAHLFEKLLASYIKIRNRGIAWFSAALAIFILLVGLLGMSVRNKQITYENLQEAENDLYALVMDDDRFIEYRDSMEAYWTEKLRNNVIDQEKYDNETYPAEMASNYYHAYHNVYPEVKDMRDEVEECYDARKAHNLETQGLNSQEIAAGAAGLASLFCTASAITDGREAKVYARQLKEQYDYDVKQR